MTIVDTYLARLEAALRGTNAHEREEILSDLRSLIQERLESDPGSLEALLQRLGPPEQLAESYRMEGLLSEAVRSSAPLTILRASLRWAGAGLLGFVTALVAFMGYTMSLAFFAVAALKPIFPQQTGLFTGPETFVFGTVFPTPSAGTHEHLGYWIIPVSILLGLACFVLTTRASRWLMARRMNPLARRIDATR